MFLGCLTVGKCFRYKVYPEYKGNRKYAFDEEYGRLMKAVKVYLMEEYKCNYIDGELEADDLVVIYKKMLLDKYTPIIISPDKDILNLEGKHYNPKVNKWVMTDKDLAHRYFWESMLIGDSADNIKGCKGIGPANAPRVLANSTDYKNTVFNKYCDIYGENKGINEFYKNYKCLHMEDEYVVDYPHLVNILNKEESEPEGKSSDTKETC